VPLQEGVTPTGKSPILFDVACTILQFGDFIRFTDVIEDTHEDPLLNEFTDLNSEQAAELYDLHRAGVLLAGTNIMRTNGVDRVDVNTVVSRDQLRSAIRILKKQEAKRITKLITAGPNIGTKPIMPAFVLVCHSDMQPDFERMDGWTPIAEYPSTQGLINGEAGSVGELRVVFDNNLTPWANGGGAAGNMLSTGGVSADVYPLLIIGQDAYGIVPLAGKNSVETYIVNPKASDSDPIAQRGSIGWKGWTGTVILNDLNMLRIETACQG
jgi:N4-gp56 family major capsid protein